MSARKDPPEYKSNKQLVQCQRCGKWMTLQGLNGHVRFFHERDWEPERAMVVLLGSADMYAQNLIIKSILRPAPLLKEEREALLACYRLYVVKNSQGSGGTPKHPGTQSSQLPFHRWRPGGSKAVRPGPRNPRFLGILGHQNGTGSRRGRTLAECPVCHREMTPTGLGGHIRFRHPQYWIVNKALTDLVQAGDSFARSIVLNDVPRDTYILVELLRRYRKAIGR